MRVHGLELVSYLAPRTSQVLAQNMLQARLLMVVLMTLFPQQFGSVPAASVPGGGALGQGATLSDISIDDQDWRGHDNVMMDTDDQADSPATSPGASPPAASPSAPVWPPVAAPASDPPVANWLLD